MGDGHTLRETPTQGQRKEETTIGTQKDKRIRQKLFEKKIVVRVKDDEFRDQAADAVDELHGQNMSDFIRDTLQKTIDEQEKKKSKGGSINE